MSVDTSRTHHISPSKSLRNSGFSEIFQNVTDFIKTIAPGQRIKYQPSMEILKCPQDPLHPDSSDFDWDYVEEIQMKVRGQIPHDIFVTLRFDDDFNELIIDFYRLPVF